MGFTTYHKMLTKMAWSFTSSTQVPFDEIMGELTVKFYEAKESFDPNKGTQFSTHLYRCCQNHLSIFCEKEQRWQQGKLSEKDGEESPLSKCNEKGINEELLWLIKNDPMWKEMVKVGLLSRAKNITKTITNALRKKSYTWNQIDTFLSQVQKYRTA